MYSKTGQIDGIWVSRAKVVVKLLSISINPPELYKFEDYG
jgi:hypothetical protein